MSEAVDELKRLHTTLVDTKNGYEKAVKDARDTDVLQVFRAMLELHTNAELEVARIFHKYEPGASGGGSFMGAVHKAVIDARSLVTGLHVDALTSFVDGERRVLKRYDAALAASGLHDSDAVVIRGERDALAQAVDRMRSASGERGGLGASAPLNSPRRCKRSGKTLAERTGGRRPWLSVLSTTGNARYAIIKDDRVDLGMKLLNEPYKQRELAKKTRRVIDEGPKSGAEESA